MSSNIFNILSSISADVVLSKGGYSFQSVIDDFENADYINIVTYNITTYGESELLKIIKKIPYDVPVNLVLNIPKKSFGSPDAPKQIFWYLNTLERHKFNDLNIFFNFSNHAKLVMTNNKVYIGSQNFSDASSNKMELGILVNEANEVTRINQKIFETIKSNSIRYATSDYVIRMESIQDVMQGIFEELRYNLFTFVGDPPYVPEVETFNINEAYFPKEEWARFKELDEDFFNIINEISDEYEDIFDNTKVEALKADIIKHLKTFISEIDDFNDYLNSFDSNLWDRFYEIDNGDTDSIMEIVLGDLHEEKDSKFSHLNYRGEELLKSFKGIEPKIENVLDLVDEIKYEMLKKSVYENQSIIED